MLPSALNSSRRESVWSFARRSSTWDAIREGFQIVAAGFQYLPHVLAGAAQLILRSITAHTALPSRKMPENQSSVTRRVGNQFVWSREIPAAQTDRWQRRELSDGRPTSSGL